MHFSNLNRDIFGYIDPDCALREEQRAVLEDNMSFCDVREDADILIFERVPEHYDVTHEVPMLCLEKGEESDNCFVPENWTQQEISSFLSCAAACKSSREALLEKTPVVSLMAADEVLFCEMLGDILRDQQKLGCVAISTMEFANNAGGCVVYLDETLAGDSDAKAACCALQIPVLVVLAKGMSAAQAKEFCPNAYDVCDLYDVWQIQESLTRMLQLDEKDMGFYAGLLSLYGIGRRRDVAFGMHSIKRSAQMGDETALLFLSLCRRFAVGCRQDAEKSQRLRAQAAQTLLDEKKTRSVDDIRRVAVLSKFISDDLLLEGERQRARVVATQAHRLCDEYIAQNDDVICLDACAKTALQAADLAQDENDTAAYVKLYLQYADLTYRTKVEKAEKSSLTREQCDSVLATLDTIAQYLLSEEANKDEALYCVQIGVNWQQHVFDTWQDDTSRAALCAYLEQRGQLYLQNNDVRAVEDFTCCIALCKDYAQAENAARFEANCYLNLGRAHFACEQYEESLQALQTAKALWQTRFDLSEDADSANALCQAIACLAKTAVWMQHENAVDLCNEAVERCEEFANRFRSVPVWESLARSYGVRAKFFSPSPLSVEDYGKEASIWLQLQELTYEPAYASAQKAALALAKADEKTLAPPTAWQKFTSRVKNLTKKKEKKVEEKVEENVEEPAQQAPEQPREENQN